MSKNDQRLRDDEFERWFNETAQAAGGSDKVAEFVDRSGSKTQKKTYLAIHGTRKKKLPKKTDDGYYTKKFTRELEDELENERGANYWQQQPPKPKRYRQEENKLLSRAKNATAMSDKEYREEEKRRNSTDFAGNEFEQFYKEKKQQWQRNPETQNYEGVYELNAALPSSQQRNGEKGGTFHTKAYNEAVKQQEDIELKKTEEDKAAAVRYEDLQMRYIVPTEADFEYMEQHGEAAWRKWIADQMDQNAPSAVKSTKNEIYYLKQDGKNADMTDVRLAPDFKQVVQSGSALKNLAQFSEGKRNVSTPVVVDGEGKQINGDILSEYLTKDEKETLLYYAGKEDYNEVGKYYDILERGLNARHQKVKSKEWEDFANEHKFLGGVGNILASPFQGLGFLGTVGQNIENAITGEYEPVDPNAPAFAPTHFVNATQEGITRDMSSTEAAITDFALGTGQFAAALPFGAAASPAILGASAAGQAALDATQRGSTAGQAMMNGLGSGLLSYEANKIPINRLLGASGKATKAGFGSLWKQGGLNAAENVISEIGQTIIDEEVMGENSRMSVRQKELEAEGLSPQEARKSVVYDYYWRNPVKAAATGFVTGVALDGAAQVKQKISQSNVVSQIAEAVRKMTRGKAPSPEVNAKMSEALSDALLGSRRDNGTNLGENLTLKILEKANIPITQGDMVKSEWDDLTKTVANFAKPPEKVVETDKPQGYNEVTHAAASKPPDPFRESLIASESAKVWGTSKTQENQGVVHFYDYQTTQPDRLGGIAERLGLPPGTFRNTCEGFDNFTKQAQKVVEIGERRTLDGKDIYYVGSATNPLKGVIVIIRGGEIQTMMSGSHKSFTTRK